MLNFIKDIIRLHSPKVPLSNGIRPAVGITATIFIILLLHEVVGFPLILAPLVATSFVVFAAPSALYSQPVNVILGNILGAIIGVIFISIHPGSILLAALAIGLCTFLIIYLRIPHPPAVVFPLMMYLSHFDEIFTLFSAFFGSIIIVLIGIIFHRYTHTEYPIKITRAKF